jgi:hypothetical protein
MIDDHWVGARSKGNAAGFLFEVVLVIDVDRVTESLLARKLGLGGGDPQEGTAPRKGTE